ncbi:MAG TPA: hypothetical protein VMI06_18290 [Terriglobia bacterium]|nr:hypothetical protein [Terriglobia bacterium]
MSPALSVMLLVTCLSSLRVGFIPETFGWRGRSMRTEQGMTINENIRFNGRTQDEVERKYMEWHRHTGRRVHVTKLHPVERLDSGLPGPESGAHDEEFTLLVDYEDQPLSEPAEQPEALRSRS